MNSLDKITLKAFLVALMRLDEPLPTNLQNQLHEIGKTFPSEVAELHAIAKSYSPLELEYKDARLALQKDSERFRSSVLEANHSTEVSDEKLMNFAVEVFNAEDSLCLVRKVYTQPSVLRQLLFQPQPQAVRRLSELGGALPATRPYPGRDTIRQEVGEHLAKQILGGET